MGEDDEGHRAWLDANHPNWEREDAKEMVEIRAKLGLPPAPPTKLDIALRERDEARAMVKELLSEIELHESGYHHVTPKELIDKAAQYV